MAKQKYYVVWQGVQPGIYTSWEECRKQIEGYPGARFKAFNTLEEASTATPNIMQEKNNSTTSANAEMQEKNNAPTTRGGWAVDAACSGNPGPMEYRCVDLTTGREVFHVGPMMGTNNIGEFLAIVHALALMEKQKQQFPVYSDSYNALLWVRRHHCATKLTRNEHTEQAHQLIDRAHNWLDTHTFNPTLLHKWNTKEWGEIPADFGRK